MKEVMPYVRVKDDIEDNKHIALLNNEFRKISKKTRLFYVKKNDILSIG